MEVPPPLSSCVLPQFLNVLFLTGTFYYFNSIINPFLYSVMSKRFRRAFTELKTEAMCKLCLVGQDSFSSGADHIIMVANNSNSNNSNMAVMVNKRLRDMFEYR